MQLRPNRQTDTEYLASDFWRVVPYYKLVCEPIFVRRVDAIRSLCGVPNAT
jgi:hypothetical protein